MKIKFTNVVTGEVVEIDLWDHEAYYYYMTHKNYLLTL